MAKTATLPSLRVDPQLRHDAETVLEEGESLSQLIESAVRDQVALRRHQAEFLVRGLAARDRARETGRYVSPNSVLEQLQSRLQAARQKTGRAAIPSA